MNFTGFINESINLSNITGSWGVCDCKELCGNLLNKMFLPLTWSAVLSFILVIILAVFYVKMPRDFRKNIIEKNPNFFLRHVGDIILILIVSTGMLTQGVVMYVIFGTG